MRAMRGRRVAMIFQEPSTALNPVLTVGRQVLEVIERHSALRGAAARKRALELLEAVGIPDGARLFHEYPFQLSGGLKQRAMIAAALAVDPEVLIADEPTTALDVTIQAQILNLMDELKERVGASIILITHDMGVVAEMAQRVVVMYAGQVVEEAAAGEATMDRGEDRAPFVIEDAQPLAELKPGGAMGIEVAWQAGEGPPAETARALAALCAAQPVMRLAQWVRDSRFRAA